MIVCSNYDSRSELIIFSDFLDTTKNGHPPAARVRSISSGSEGAKHSVHSPEVKRQVSRQQSGYKVYDYELCKDRGLEGKEERF